MVTEALESNPVVDQLKTNLERITATDIDSQLVRSEELGAANFRAYRPMFEKIVAFAQKLASFDWTLVPSESVEQARLRTENLANSLVEAGQLSLDKENPTAQRDNIAQRIALNFDALRQAAIPLVGFLSWETIDLSATRQALTDLLSNAEAKLSETLREASEQVGRQKTEAEEIVQAIRSASAEAGVGIHYDLFGKAATRHENLALRFLVGGIVLALATCVGAMALVLLWDVKGDISEASVLQLVLAKAVLLLVGFYATTSAIRMYRSQVHLAVVNRHRETSLQTFQAFVKATDDAETKTKFFLKLPIQFSDKCPPGS